MDKIEELLKARNDAEAQIESRKKPVTILFTDIRGSTSFFSMEGDVEGMAMIHRHNTLLFPLIKKYRGRIVKTIGDAIMAVFNKPANAILGACAMQKALKEYNGHRAPNQQIHIRIGMHSGMGLEKEHDVYGDVVNTASRVEHQSEPDHIYISESMAEVAQTLGFTLTEVGPVELKGKVETIRLHKLNWESFDLSKARAVPDFPLRHWMIALGIGLALALVSWKILSMQSPVPPAAQQAVGQPAGKTQSLPTPATPEIRPLTRGDLLQILMERDGVQKILTANGKPISRDAFLAGSFRIFKESSGETMNETVTRGEFAILLEDLMILATGDASISTAHLGLDVSPFADVPTGRPFFNAAVSATENGLFPREDLFKPNEPVDRALADSALSALDRWLSNHGGALPKKSAWSPTFPLLNRGVAPFEKLILFNEPPRRFAAPRLGQGGEILSPTFPLNRGTAVQISRNRGKAFSPPRRGGVARSAGVVPFEKLIFNEPPRRFAALRLSQGGEILSPTFPTVPSVSVPAPIASQGRESFSPATFGAKPHGGVQ